MKRISIILSLLFCSVQFALSQKVDNITVVQSGDLINIRYKILNSSSAQLFRVKVLCSLNGGLNTEIRSFSGDAGDNVAGGRSDYLVVWDVLKDVDEIKSVEFIVRAELISDNSAIYQNEIPVVKTNNNNTGWDRKRMNVLLSGEFKGPKFGSTIAYLGNWGFSVKYVKGKSVKSSDSDLNALLSDVPSLPVFSVDLTKRILNNGDFQMHFALGVAVGEFIFYQKNFSNIYTFSYHNILGAEAGLYFGVKNISAFAGFSYFDPGPIEQESSDLCWSVKSAIDLGFGYRF
jgi:hypothetical protein